VLVEKSFTMTEAEAIEVTQLAQRQGLLVMEAMWTRFLPHMRHVREVVASGRIGEVRSLHAEHAQRLPDSPSHRINDPLLAGGALLDLGIYPISFAHDLLGAPEHVQARATFKPTGVDGSVATIMQHQGGAISTSYSSSETLGTNTATVLGTAGRIEISSIWYTPTKVTVHDDRGAVVEVFEEPVSGRGMQLQAMEVERLIAAGSIASSLMPPEESVRIMATMDAIRSTIGLRYPDE
jgi:predicted dehydrogenase